MVQISLNFTLHNGYLVFLSSSITCFFKIWGMLVMVIPDEDASTMDVLMKIFNESKYSSNFIRLYFHTLPGYFIMWYLLNSIQKEILKAWLLKSTIQKEMDIILSKLEEAIITKDVDNNISFINEKGTKIVRMITKFI